MLKYISRKKRSLLSNVIMVQKIIHHAKQLSEIFSIKMTIDFYARDGFALPLWMFTQNHTLEKRDLERNYNFAS